MDEKQYAILKYLSEQSSGIETNTFPNRIQSMFSTRTLQAGGFIHEMEIILKSHKKWVEIRSGVPGYWLSDEGKLALQAVELEKQHTNYVNELEFQKLEKSVKDLDQKIDNFKPSNLRSNTSILISLLAAVIAAIALYIKLKEG